jgi:hypothetical protein
MNTEQMPDFDLPTPKGDFPQPPKKPRRKPTKKRKAVAPVDRSAAIRLGKAKAKKRRKVVKRRGRPAGSLNKPKVEAATSSSTKTIVSVYDRCNAILSELAPHERGPVLECLK